MSGNTRIGWSGATLKPRKSGVSIANKSGSPEVTVSYDVNMADHVTAIAAEGISFGTGYTGYGGAYVAAVLEEITIKADGPQNAIVNYIYRVPDPNNPRPPVGQLVLTADANPISVPIGQHPDATSQNYDSEKKIGIGDWEGVTHFIQPQPTFSREEIVNSFTFSEANIIENVGKIFSGAQMNTNGMSAASDGKWLKVERSISTSGDNFAERDRWQFAENGWDPTIYDPAT